MSIENEHKTYLDSGGFFELPSGFLKIKGPEAPDFLHRVTTQDFKNFPAGTGKGCALLDSSGTVISCFGIYRLPDSFLLASSLQQTSKAFEGLEKLHFAEDFVIEDIGTNFLALSVQGINITSRLAAHFENLPTKERDIVETPWGFIVKKSDFHSQEGFHFAVQKPHADKAKRDLVNLGLKSLSLELWELLAAESGRFSMGVDIKENNIIVEAPLDSYVARNKGCYPGQETVERIFTYKRLSKRLMGVRAKGKIENANLPAKLFSGQENAGLLTSLHYIPWRQETLGFAMVRSPFSEANQGLKTEGLGQDFTIFSLPDTFDLSN